MIDSFLRRLRATLRRWRLGDAEDDEWNASLGWHIEMEYPADGDTAIAWVLLDELEYASLRLENINLGATGDARLAGARVVVDFCLAQEAMEHGPAGTVDEAEAQRHLARARHFLLENERGRLPFADDD